APGVGRFPVAARDTAELVTVSPLPREPIASAARQRPRCPCQPAANRLGTLMFLSEPLDFAVEMVLHAAYVLAVIVAIHCDVGGWSQRERHVRRRNGRGSAPVGIADIGDQVH